MSSEITAHKSARVATDVAVADESDCWPQNENPRIEFRRFRDISKASVSVPSPETLVPECVAGAGFQMALEGGGAGFFVEGDVAFEAPGAIWSGRWIAAAVVVENTLAKILSEADVAAGRRRNGLEAVDVEHGRGLGNRPMWSFYGSALLG